MISQRGKLQIKENQKAKGKSQKAKISVPGRWPGSKGAFAAR
jgi:hypothetical protein